MRRNSWESDLFKQRFWAKVDKTKSCWNWRGSTCGGYGTVRMNMRRVLAHRAAWKLTFGDIPNGMQVLHHCDHPSCVNPAHLFLGTQTDNLRDMSKKGRGRTGDQSCEHNGNARLQLNHVQEIQRTWSMLKYGEKGKLATSLGISHAHALRIAQGQSWNPY